MLMLLKDRMEPTGEVLSQYEFLQKVESNLVVQATINYSPQSPLLTEITGKYYRTDAEGKRTETGRREG